MAISEYNYIPTYIKRIIANKPKDVVTANYWNELFNLLITQGDHTAEELGNILNHFTGVITGLANDTSTKQDKLIAGKNITIAEDGKTISATQVIEIALEEQSDGSYTADTTFSQLKAEVDRGKQLMLVKDESKIFVLNSANDSEIIFIGSDALGVAYTLITVTVNDVWKVESALTPSTSNISDIFSSIGLLANLTTDDKTHLVAAINEVNNNTDLALLRIDYDRSTKQDKLIAGENITIAADGKTISAIGGNSASIMMRVNSGYIQYSTDNGNTWSNLIAEADLKGDKGDTGATGSQGPKGDKGDTGSQGLQGIQGPKGDKGDKGDTGPQGPSGVSPTISLEETASGVLIDVTDATGTSTAYILHGDKGDKGDTGPQGPQGEKGDTGPRGLQGIQGVQGPQGDKGDKGDKGDTGPQGPSGVSPTISLEETASGVMINIVNSDGASSTGYVLHGQSAYDAARNGGYTDTQANFYTDLAATQGFASALADKQDTISDLETIRSGAAKGATALQAVPSTYRTAAAQDTIDNGLSDRVSAIEGKEAGWNGKYSKPTDGIPKTDLAAAVQTSLGKADTALQQHQSLSAYRTASAQDAIDNKKVDKVSGKGLSTNDYTAAAKAKVDAIPAHPKYTDTVYDDTAVRNRLTAIEKHEDVTLTADTSRISNVSYTAKYFQLLGIVFVRIYGKIKASLNAGYDYDLFSIDSRVPDSNTALSVKCGKDAMALAKTSNKGSAIQIRPLESGINGYDVFITGFWFT